MFLQLLVAAAVYCHIRIRSVICEVGKGFLVVRNSMGDIIKFDVRKVESNDSRSVNGAAHERFLIEEGLELLAIYRSIPDRNIRLAIKELAKTMAHASKPVHIA